MDKRNKRFMINSALSLAQQMVTIVCGLILPQLILKSFGSSINGLTASITQFLSFITLLQGGVGTVARLSFYKPLAEKDTIKISIAYKTVSQFYRRFAAVFLFYLLALSCLYPRVIEVNYDYWFVSSLVLILGLASIFEYFFGQASQMLLLSAQRNYIYSITQILCTLISTVIGVILINQGRSIHTIKLATAIIYVIRPLVLFYYVKRKFSIDKHVKGDKTLLSQRTAALVRHIAFYIHTSTDIMVLTLFTNVLWVSVYSVYRYVINSLSSLVSSILGNTEVVFGDMIAKQETKQLEKQFLIYDLFSKILSCSCFVTCLVLIDAFVKIYTKGVSDIDYSQPVFASILVFAEMIYCMGINYQNIYISAGHIKKTEWIAITEAVLNLTISIALVWKLGIIGVAIGTAVAMIFKSIANIYYMKKNVLNVDTVFILKSYSLNLGLGIIIYLLSIRCLPNIATNFVSFFICGAFVFALIIMIYIVANVVVFKNEMAGILHMLSNKLKKR